jgi:group I intron endonuclease
MFIEEYARGYIYKLTFGNGKVYIGQTVDFEKRLKEHKANFKNKRKRSMLYHGWRKHDLISADILLVCNICDLNEFEIHLIAEYDSQDNGYNTTSGGDDNPLNSPDGRKNYDAAMARRNSNQVWRKEISERTKRMHLDPEYRAARLAGVAKKNSDPHYMAAQSERSRSRMLTRHSDVAFQQKMNMSLAMRWARQQDRPYSPYDAAQEKKWADDDAADAAQLAADLAAIDAQLAADLATIDAAASDEVRRCAT